MIKLTIISRFTGKKYDFYLGNSISKSKILKGGLVSLSALLKDNEEKSKDSKESIPLDK